MSLIGRLTVQTNVLQEAEWHALRTTAHRENGILPIGFLPWLPRKSGRVLTEPDVGCDQGSPASIAPNAGSSRVNLR